MLALSLLAVALQICLSCNVEGRKPKTLQRGSLKPEQQLQCESEMITLGFFYLNCLFLQGGHILGLDHCRGGSGDPKKACLNTGCSFAPLVSSQYCTRVHLATRCTDTPTAVQEGYAAIYLHHGFQMPLGRML